MMAGVLRLIGDVHGKYDSYLNVVHAEHSKVDVQYTLQVGDMGFNYQCLEFLDPKKHKVLGGNHDNYETEYHAVPRDEVVYVNQTAHFLGDYGTWTVPGFGDIFFIRGGHSIDRQYRTFGIDWWPTEQLSWTELHKAVDAYEAAKPDFVVSHECPTSLIPLVSGIRLWDGVPIKPSQTADALEQMLGIHQPKQWVFGHHHKDWTKKVGKTKFTCLAELSHKDFKLKEVKDEKVESVQG